MHFVIHPPLCEHFAHDAPTDKITSLLFSFIDTEENDICTCLKTDCDIEIFDTFGGAERIKSLKTLVDDRLSGVREQRIAELRLLFIGLARTIQGNHQRQHTPHQTWDEERIARLEEYFNIQVQDPNCSKQQLAEEIGVCESQLTRILAKTYNSNFSEILRNSRLTIAEAMLKQGDKSVKEIAEAVGYLSFEKFQKDWLKKFNKPIHY